MNQETNKITKITFIYYLNSLPVYQIVFPSEVICFEALNVTLSYKSTTPAERGHFKMPKRWKIFNKDIYEFEVCLLKNLKNYFCWKRLNWKMSFALGVFGVPLK